MDFGFTALLSLLDRSIALSAESEKNRAKICKEYVYPLWACFEAVHQNYMKSCDEYFKLLTTTNELVTASHPIFHRIEMDSLLSASTRSRVSGPAFKDSPSKRTDDLMSCMIRYLQTIPGVEESNYAVGKCGPRLNLSQRLSKASTREGCVLEVRETIRSLNDAYDEAREAYEKLRLELLKPNSIFG